MEIEADIGPAGVFGRHMRNTAPARLLLHQQLRHSGLLPGFRRLRAGRIDRLVKDEELPDGVSREAARDHAPEGRAGNEFEDRPGHADHDDGDAPPERPEKRMFVVLQFDRASVRIAENLASRPYSLPPS